MGYLPSSDKYHPNAVDISAILDVRIISLDFDCDDPNVIPRVVDSNGNPTRQNPQKIARPFKLRSDENPSSVLTVDQSRTFLYQKAVSGKKIIVKKINPNVHAIPCHVLFEMLCHK